MTVGELIAQLSKFPGSHDAVIVFPSVGNPLTISGVWLSEVEDTVEVAVEE